MHTLLIPSAQYAQPLWNEWAYTSDKLWSSTKYILSFGGPEVLKLHEELLIVGVFFAFRFKKASPRAPYRFLVYNY